MTVLNQRKPPVFLLFLFFAAPLATTHPATVFAAAPAILFASVIIAWAAESAQFFIAQGFALAILAWLQTLPEFAVEAVLAWKQQVPLLLANLTGALRLLTGFGWPVIYLTAATTKMRRGDGRLGFIQLGKRTMRRSGGFDWTAAIHGGDHRQIEPLALRRIDAHPDLRGVPACAQPHAPRRPG
ncbi:MAG: hypothetical protein WDO18_09375 [Acidobacteriota bacterium]